MRLLSVLILLVATSSVVSGQDVKDSTKSPAGPTVAVPQTVVEVFKDVTATDRFTAAYVKVLKKLVDATELTPAEELRLKIAVYTPAGNFLFKEYAVTQMALSLDADALPFNDVGKIDRDNIDWDGFDDFLIKVVPFHLELLERFGL